MGGPSVVPVEHARPMRSECLRRCPQNCPANTIELMEANCKPSCRKGKILLSESNYKKIYLLIYTTIS